MNRDEYADANEELNADEYKTKRVCRFILKSDLLEGAVRPELEGAVADSLLRQMEGEGLFSNADFKAFVPLYDALKATGVSL